MNHFEEDRLVKGLKAALRREHPSADFSTRVLAEVSRRSQREPWWKLRAPILRWAVAMILCVVVIAGSVYRRVEQQRRKQGEIARQQVITALQIASSKMQIAQSKIQTLSQR